MLLLMVPLKAEIKALLHSPALSSLKFKEERLERGSLWKPEGLSQQNLQCNGLILAWAGHGKVLSALRTQHYLNHLENEGVSIDGVLCVGAGGGLTTQVQPGDVVIGTMTIEHDFYEKFDSKAQRPQFCSDEKLFNCLKSYSPGGLSAEFQVFSSPVASGDEDIVSDSRASELFELTGAYAVGWEGAGVGRACREANQPFVEVRGITDLANAVAMSDFKLNLKLAMNHVGEVLFSTLNLGAAQT